MDASRLTVAFAILIAVYGLGRLVAGPMSRTGDLMAGLFVPPDRTLGWPHGVQEGDEPWGWRPAAPPIEVFGSTLSPDLAPEPVAAGPLATEARRPAGPFVVPVDRVRPVRLTLRTR